MPQFITKYWRAKALSIIATIVGTIGVWATLAWPAWTAPGPATASPEEISAALQYLASVSAPVGDSVAPAPIAPDTHQIVVVTRRAPQQHVVVVTDAAQGSDDLPPIVLPTPIPAAAPPARAPAPAPSRPPAATAPPAPAPAPAPKPAPPPAPAPSKGS